MDGKRGKKRNFSQTEINVLVGEVQARKKVLFGRYYIIQRGVLRSEINGLASYVESKARVFSVTKVALF